ncbi:hypothetical protein AZE42_09758 [Rhizopogon vesiculosus]|uniref:Uncharacterized protein n=1 Tax=Rhizopogon vesiculosus TaxID=180088 RepID=A0A1J8Q8Z2_9AGAM|nr:hypothetical protein AZE42_09758 [Rhizopogon vesiculosus]
MTKEERVSAVSSEIAQ